MKASDRSSRKAAGVWFGHLKVKVVTALRNHKWTQFTLVELLFVQRFHQYNSKCINIVAEMCWEKLVKAILRLFIYKALYD